MSSLAALKQRLAEVLAPDRPAAPGVATGLDALDRALASGGIPRGRLTEVVGARGSGRTTLVRRVVERAAAAGLWVAYVDATRTLAPRDWAEVATRHEGVWVVRPADPARGAWCADVLLRSGAFGLVVLDGAPPLSRAVAVRLTGLARESEAALVVTGDGGEHGGGSALGGALRLRVEARGVGDDDGQGRRHWRRHRQPSWSQQQLQQQQQQGEEEGQHRQQQQQQHRRFVVAIEKGGIHQTVEVSCAIAVARRLCTHPEVPDRRGVGGRTGGGRGTRDGGRAARGDGRAARAAGGGSGRATA
ncbi:MAG TPA: hypothetical protein VFJ74_01935 [Gemmatimonadaceae bacterium]|nr:hypothetical protein [Gemmatimonadaceae bacterium]